LFEEALERLEQIEAKLSLPRRFYLALREEDDWSFVIKLSALFEAASTQLLTVRLGAPMLEDSFSHLDYGDQRFGKLTLLSKLGCLSGEEVKFLQLMLELRNKLAHNIANVSFSFSKYVCDLDAQRQRKFATEVRAGADEMIFWNCEDRPREEFILAYPRFSIWMTGADVLLSMHDKTFQAS
jgi:hypothetical protein